MTLDWGVAMRTLPGEIACGDCATVVRHVDGFVIAVADGLGHGPEAAVASGAAIAAVDANAGAPIDDLIRLCHERLRSTRGAALSVATLDAYGETLAWGGVGNVDGVLLPHSLRGDGAQREAILLQGGIVGYQLPKLRIRRCAVAVGDTLIFTTDGILSSYLEGVVLYEPPQVLASLLLDKYFRGTDDGLVLVARLLEAAA